MAYLHDDESFPLLAGWHVVQFTYPSVEESELGEAFTGFLKRSYSRRGLGVHEHYNFRPSGKK